MSKLHNTHHSAPYNGSSTLWTTKNHPQDLRGRRGQHNPVVAACHRYDQPAIVKALELTVKKDRVNAKAQFLSEDAYREEDKARAEKAAAAKVKKNAEVNTVKHGPKDKMMSGALTNKWAGMIDHA